MVLHGVIVDEWRRRLKPRQVLPKLCAGSMGRFDGPAAPSPLVPHVHHLVLGKKLDAALPRLGEPEAENGNYPRHGTENFLPDYDHVRYTNRYRQLPTRIPLTTGKSAPIMSHTKVNGSLQC